MLTTATRTLARPAAIRRFALAAGGARSQHTLPDLPYAYNALEPYIAEDIMKLHHQKHHQAYVTGLNAAEEAYAKTQSPKERIKLQPALKFNGGGHINHTLFWKNLAPANAGGGQLSSGPLKSAIEESFGSVDAFKKKMSATTAAIQGSGWGWLGYNPETKKLEIVTTPNQDPLLSHVPIIGIDIWEHAFYLQYKNVKADYLSAIWNVINWKEAEQRFTEAAK
ncbi:superoxide dismutase mitochondrial [Gloeophyllum trabeum ATCC 11539]|uniref:Superoxide dismutase n=1 Tax=Gloeophyllum trabeum (strain ATCC 11539 / FP-39264 / Madison 617) TaxID=670483 RepID=S7PR25_GLOTA|nr:superoxide dismutase mitochondrial [Gloeophyllum trabeum ATCC 11539]EPQ50291.1 superoxide dismutase mitochondrial [Gloeophyllum trabeum ATCC 11539]